MDPKWIFCEIFSFAQPKLPPTPCTMTMALLLSRFLLFKLLLASTHAFVTRLHSFTLPVKLSSLQAGTSADEGEHVSIEYCTGCRWMLRSTWLAQELLTTFQQELDSVALVPSRPPAPGGVFVRIFGVTSCLCVSLVSFSITPHSVVVSDCYM